MRVDFISLERCNKIGEQEGANLVVQLARFFYMNPTMHFGPTYKLCIAYGTCEAQGTARTLHANVKPAH